MQHQHLLCRHNRAIYQFRCNCFYLEFVDMRMLMRVTSKMRKGSAHALSSTTDVSTSPARNISFPSTTTMRTDAVCRLLLQLLVLLPLGVLAAKDKKKDDGKNVTVERVRWRSGHCLYFGTLTDIRRSRLLLYERIRFTRRILIRIYKTDGGTLEGILLWYVLKKLVIQTSLNSCLEY